MRARSCLHRVVKVSFLMVLVDLFVYSEIHCVPGLRVQDVGILLMVVSCPLWSEWSIMMLA